MKATYILGAGVLAGALAIAMHSYAESQKTPGEKAKKGDDAEFDLQAIAGALTVPPGATHGVLHVAELRPDFLVGTVTGVFVPDLMGGPPKLQAVPPNPIGAGIRVPKTAVTAVMRQGALI